MDLENKILELIKDKAMKSGEIAEALGVDKKEVDKVIKKLKKEEKIESPKRCFYQAK